MKVTTFFLLFGPDSYFWKLRDTTVDCLVNDFVWKDLLEQLTADWRDFTLYVCLYYFAYPQLIYFIVQATVLLNANIAFLAIQSIDQPAEGHRSYTQIGSYFSIVTSIGAIALGLLLVKIHNIPLDVRRIFG